MYPSILMVNVLSYPASATDPSIPISFSAYATCCTIHIRSHVYIFMQYYCTCILYCIGTVFKLVIDIVKNKQENKQKNGNKNKLQP